jgi:hypothetical protein
MSNELEQHRFSYEGSTGQLAQHLVDDHGVPETTVSRWSNGLDQGSWSALDGLHREEHAKEAPTSGNELREAAQRVTGYVRARKLLSITDNEQLDEVSIFFVGTSGPKTFTLLAADLEALAAHAIGATPAHPSPRCGRRVRDIGGWFESLECGMKLGADGACPRVGGHIQ